MQFFSCCLRKQKPEHTISGQALDSRTFYVLLGLFVRVRVLLSPPQKLFRVEKCCIKSPKYVNYVEMRTAEHFTAAAQFRVII